MVMSLASLYVMADRVVALSRSQRQSHDFCQTYGRPLGRSDLGRAARANLARASSTWVASSPRASPPTARAPKTARFDLRVRGACPGAPSAARDLRVAPRPRRARHGGRHRAIRWAARRSWASSTRSSNCQDRRRRVGTVSAGIAEALVTTLWSARRHSCGHGLQTICRIGSMLGPWTSRSRQRAARSGCALHPRTEKDQAEGQGRAAKPSVATISTRATPQSPRWSLGRGLRDRPQEGPTRRDQRDAAGRRRARAAHHLHGCHASARERPWRSRARDRASRERLWKCLRVSSSRKSPPTASCRSTRTDRCCGLRCQARDIVAERHDKTVFVVADDAANYARLVQVSTCQAAGATTLGIATEVAAQ